MEKEPSWFGYLRLITPILLFVVTFIVGTLKADSARIENKLDCVDSKLFQHLTNDEMHTPRTLAVWRPEFQSFVKNNDESHSTINYSLSDIKAELRRIK
jgi:hypothetical protein